MIRLMIGTGLLATGTAFAQSPPSLDYLPLRPNAKWVYGLDDQKIVVECVGAKRFRDRDAFVLVTSTGGEEKARDLYAVNEDGVYRVRSKGDDVVPPIKILNIPSRKGVSWKVNSQVDDKVKRGEFKILDNAAVIKTPAGEFEHCILVEGRDVDVAGTHMTVRTWFAPNVGIVKLSYVIQGTVVTLDLVSFEAGEAPGVPPPSEAVPVVPVPQVQPWPVFQSCRCMPTPTCRKITRRHCRLVRFRGRP